MKIDEDALDKAFHMAKRSSFKRFGSGCVIVKNDKIISTGWSHMSSVRMNSSSSIHAEVHALGRGRHLDLDGAVAYVATVSKKSGNRTVGKSCLNCAISQYAAGIRYVVYTIDNSNYGVLDLSKDLSDLKVYSLHKPKD